MQARQRKGKEEQSKMHLLLAEMGFVLLRSSPVRSTKRADDDSKKDSLQIVIFTEFDPPSSCYFHRHINNNNKIDFIASISWIYTLAPFRSPFLKRNDGQI